MNDSPLRSLALFLGLLLLSVALAVLASALVALVEGR
jgi:hypothetical protein